MGNVPLPAVQLETVTHKHTHKQIFIVSCFQYSHDEEMNMIAYMLSVAVGITICIKLKWEMERTGFLEGVKIVIFIFKFLSSFLIALNRFYF